MVYSINYLLCVSSYDSKTLANDIALLKLNQPVVFSARVNPVCLKQAQSPYVGYIGVVVGWGSLQSGGPGVDQLREVKVTQFLSLTYIIYKLFNSY